MPKFRLRIITVILVVSFLLSPRIPAIAQTTPPPDQPGQTATIHQVFLPSIAANTVNFAPIAAPPALAVQQCPEATIVHEVVCGDRVCEVVRKCNTNATGGALFLASTQSMGNPMALVLALVTAYAGTSVFSYWISNHKDTFALKVASLTLAQDFVSSQPGAGKQSYTFENPMKVERLVDRYDDGWTEDVPADDVGDYRQYGTGACYCWVYDAGTLSTRPDNLIALYQLVTGDGSKATEIKSFVITTEEIVGKTPVYKGLKPDVYIADLTIAIPTAKPGVPAPPSAESHPGADEIRTAKRTATWIESFNHFIDTYDPKDPCKPWDWVGYRLWPSGDKTWFFINYTLQIFGSDAKIRQGLGLVLNNVNPTALDQLKPSGNPLDPMRPKGPSWWTETDPAGGTVTWVNTIKDDDCPDPTGLVPAVILQE